MKPYIYTLFTLLIIVFLSACTAPYYLIIVPEGGVLLEPGESITTTLKVERAGWVDPVTLILRDIPANLTARLAPDDSEQGETYKLVISATAEAEEAVRFITIEGVDGQEFTEIEITIGNPEKKADLQLELRVAESVTLDTMFEVTLSLTNTRLGFVKGNDFSNEFYHVYLYLSEDSEVSSGQYGRSYRSNDRTLEEGNIRQTPDLDAGETKELKRSYRLPKDIPAGDYFLCAYIDPLDVVSELNETNNSDCKAISVQ